MSPAALSSSSSAAHIGTVLSPLSLPLQLPLPSLPSQAAERSLLELEYADENNNNDSDVLFYDLYQSPCRGILLASNDELLDQNDLDQMSDDSERNSIISYNNNNNNNGNSDSDSDGNTDTDLYKAYYYLFDDLAYCGTTFFGGCRFLGLDALEDAIAIDEIESSSAAPQHSYANWTVVYDYEIHYVDNSKSDRKRNSNSYSYSNTGYVSNDEPDESPHTRGDPIPALEYLETIVLEHLGEVVGLSRRGCDADTDPNDAVAPGGRNSISSRKRQTRRYQHDFSDEELERILAISSEPKDVLDPDYADCMVPVSSRIGETSDCIPVTGGIRIYLNTTGILGGGDESSTSSSSSQLADLELSIQSGFQRLIRFGMQQNLYVSEEDDNDDSEFLVKHVSFIGTRIVVGDAEDGEETVDDETNTTSSTSGTKEEDTTLPPLLNGLDDGDIDESNPSKKGVAGLAIASIGIVALAAVLAAISTKTKDPVSADDANGDLYQFSMVGDNGEETPVDIETECEVNEDGED